MRKTHTHAFRHNFAYLIGGPDEFNFIVSDPHNLFETCLPYTLLDKRIFAKPL